MPGVLATPAALCAKQKSTQAKSPQVSPAQPAFPARVVLTVSFVLSLVIGLSCHHRRRIIHRLDIGVEISGPHDFAVRPSPVRLTGQGVHRIPRPTFSDDRPNAPLYRGGTRGLLKVICPTSQEKLSATQWHDGQIRWRVENHQRKNVKR